MTTEDIKRYIDLSNELDNLAESIFKYAKTNYEDLLRFGRYSAYETFNLYDTGMSIKYYDYGYDLYECDTLENIPFDILTDETKWKDFIDKIYQRKQEEVEKNKRKQEEVKRKLELKELDRLKAKYEGK